MDDLVGALEETLRLAVAVKTSHGAKPSPGSPADRELKELQPRLEGERLSTPVSTTHSLGSLALASAEDHLEALAVTLRAPGIILAPITLARAVLESAGRAWWIFDPEIDGERRVARGLTELLYGLRQKMALGEPLGEPDRMRLRIDEIVEAAVNHGLDLLLPDPKPAVRYAGGDWREAEPFSRFWFACVFWGPISNAYKWTLSD